MATNFPSSMDNFTNPTASDTLATVSHSSQHADLNDAVEAIETALLDGAPLFVDDANERVGIGTTTPSASLEVVGTSVFDNVYSESTSNWNFSQLRAIRNASNTANTKIASFLLDGDSVSSTNLYDSVNFVLRTDSAPTTGSTSSGLNAGLEITAPDSVRFGTGSTERVRVDDDGLDVVSGDLRIGGTAVGEWQGFTPSFLNFSATTNRARYAQVNNTVFIKMDITLTGTVGATMFIDGMPVNGLSGQTSNLYAVARDVSVNDTFQSYQIQFSGSSAIRFWGSVGGTGVDGWSVNYPFQWVSGDRFWIKGFYEAA